MPKRVYIAGPISRGDLADNINQATAAFVALAKAGLAPLCPHWSAYSKPCQRFMRGGGDVFCIATAMGNPEMNYADWMRISLAWVGVADAVLRLPGESLGSEMEVAEANRRGVPVFYAVEDVIRWANGGTALAG